MGISAGTMAVVSMASSAVGAGVQAYGAYAGGKAKAAQDQYQAQIAAMNAKIAQQNADYAIAAGETKAQTEGMKARFQRGSTLAQQGAGGLAVGSGSNARVIDSELGLGQHDQALIRANAARQAYGYKVQAAADTAQGQLYTTAASSDMAAGEIGAAGSLLSGAGSVASKWFDASRTGINFFAGSGSGSGSAFGTSSTYDDEPSSSGR